VEGQQIHVDSHEPLTGSRKFLDTGYIRVDRRFLMSALEDPRIAFLQNQAGSSGELDLPVGDGCFRINLRDENISLWQETFDQHTTAANLLLACEESNGDLKDTRLTWVVGSAIRTATASSPDAVGLLLSQLGIPEELTEAAITRCPGLGDDLVWAFYLERHGWLIATPVASVTP
jgi:hypothetical protein